MPRDLQPGRTTVRETPHVFRNREERWPGLRRIGFAILLALAFAFMHERPASAQSSGGSSGSQGQGMGGMHPHPDAAPLSTDDSDPMMDQRRLRALNNERQKQMVADTDKLLKLAKELNEEVARANSGTLTSDELHKIADIEKLARNVRQRMTEAVGAPQTSMPAPLSYPAH